jgi:hypothetical protein
MAKDNTMLLLGLAAAAAVGYYFYSKQSAGVTPAALPAGSLATTTGTPAGFSTAPTPAANANSATVVQGWFNSGALDPANRQQAFGQFGNMTADEVNQLADIIVNVWGTGGKPSAAQTAFWNAWRVKYHIDDGTYA